MPSICILFASSIASTSLPTGSKSRDSSAQVVSRARRLIGIRQLSSHIHRASANPVILPCDTTVNIMAAVFRQVSCLRPRRAHSRLRPRSTQRALRYFVSMTVGFYDGLYVDGWQARYAGECTVSTAVICRPCW